MNYSNHPLNPELLTTKSPNFTSSTLVGSEGYQARLYLLARYHEAALAYFRGAIPDQSLANELYSDLAVRLHEIDRLVHDADKQKGRFRHYLKAVLRYTIADASGNSSKDRTTSSAGDSDTQSKPNDDFLAAWRQTLINLAWRALEANCDKAYFAVLRCKSENERLTAADIAERLAPELGTLHTERQVRQIISRARKKFAGFLLEEVEYAMENPSREDLEEELRELQFLPFCKWFLWKRE